VANFYQLLIEIPNLVSYTQFTEYQIWHGFETNCGVSTGTGTYSAHTAEAVPLIQVVRLSM